MHRHRSSRRNRVVPGTARAVRMHIAVPVRDAGSDVFLADPHASFDPSRAEDWFVDDAIGVLRLAVRRRSPLGLRRGVVLRPLARSRRRNVHRHSRGQPRPSDLGAAAVPKRLNRPGRVSPDGSSTVARWFLDVFVRLARRFLDGRSMVPRSLRAARSAHTVVCAHSGPDELSTQRRHPLIRTPAGTRRGSAHLAPADRR